MTGLIRRIAIATLACAAMAAPAFAEDSWSEWAPENELGWVEGSADAPVTVIEYFSPTCSHCKEFAEEVFPVIEETYVPTGNE